MAFPNLAFAKSRAERTMTDTVTVTREPGGVDDDVFDYPTGEWTPGTPVLIYLGKCHLSRRGRDLLPHQFVEGDQDLKVINYILSLPLGSTLLRQGDVMVITASARSVHLVGRPARLEAVRFQTHEVEDQYDVELRDDTG